MDSKPTLYVTCNWQSPGELLQELLRQVGDGDVEYRLTDEVIGADFYCVINRPYDVKEFEYMKKNRTIVMRTSSEEATDGRWSDWFNDRKEFLAFMNHSSFFSNCMYNLSLSESVLLRRDISKEKVLKETVSAVLSDKSDKAGQKFRQEFLEALQTKLPKVKVDVFGTIDKNKCKNYKGTLPHKSKDLGLFPYKYTFNSESECVPGFVSEKMIDGILSECLVFYWGCPNLPEFIDKRCFVQLDPESIDRSLKMVETTINSKMWERNLPYIKACKKKILTEMSIISRLDSVIRVAKARKFFIHSDNIDDTIIRYRLNCGLSSTKNFGLVKLCDNKEIASFYNPDSLFGTEERSVDIFNTHCVLWRTNNHMVLIGDTAIPMSDLHTNWLACACKETSLKCPDWDVIMLQSPSLSKKSVENKWPMEFTSLARSDMISGAGDHISYLVSQKGLLSLLNSLGHKQLTGTVCDFFREAIDYTDDKGEKLLKVFVANKDF